MTVTRSARAFVVRLQGLVTRRRADDELHEELQAHLEMATAEHIRRGLAPNEAHRRAVMDSGGVTQAAEAVRARRGLPWLESILADVRYALRTLRRSSVYTAIVIVTLALGIGANTAIFSVVHGVLLKPLPNRDGDRLVYLRQSADGPGQADLNFSVPEVRDLRNGVPSLGGIAEFSNWSVVYRSAQGAERIDIGLVSGNYFEVMGLSPVLGRLTRRSDDGPGVPGVVVLTHAYWMKRFGGNPNVVGTTMSLDNKQATIIGVLQPAPFYPTPIDALTNMVISDHHLSATMIEGRTHRMTQVVARLKPGATLQQVRTEVASVYSRLQREYKDAYDPGSHYGVAVIPFQDILGERARLMLWLLMSAAAFVLIIAVANVANLTLMRRVRREHEIAVRAALGAGVTRLRRLLLVENLLLTLTGALLGTALAVGGVRFLTSIVARVSTRASDVALDQTVLGFMLALSIAVALLLSFLASLPREARLASWLLAGAHRSTGGLRKQRLQRALVVVQIAVSVVLLAGAGLLTRTLLRLSEVSTGLATQEILTMEVSLVSPAELLSNPNADAQAKVRYEEMRREIAALPGVVEVGLGYPLPLRSTGGFDLTVEGRARPVGAAIPHAELRTANPQFFRAAGIPLLEGRPFAATDGPASGKVVIINKTLADRQFPRESPIGKRLAWTGDVLRFTPITGEWRTIVGVIGDTQDGAPNARPSGAVYMPFTQMMAFSGGIVIRADSNVARLAGPATRIIRRIAPGAPIEHVLTMTQYRDQGVTPERVNATLVSSFGLLALIVAAVGIAGVLAFSVSTRTNEIGIRMSFGADRSRVLRMILGEGGVLLAIGLAVGLLGAFIGAGLMRRLLFGVAPHDPITFAGVAALMVLIGFVACWIPALRAARVDPAIAMRST